MSGFPNTQRSLVEARQSADAGERKRAIELVAHVYREPVIAVIMHEWGHQRADAEDLAHDFLIQAFDKEWLARYDASRGRLRTFLRACLVAFASTRAEAASRIKRGAAVTHVTLDEVDVAATDDAVDALFDQRRSP